MVALTYRRSFWDHSSLCPSPPVHMNARPAPPNPEQNAQAMVPITRRDRCRRMSEPLMADEPHRGGTQRRGMAPVRCQLSSPCLRETRTFHSSVPCGPGRRLIEHQIRGFKSKTQQPVAGEFPFLTFLDYTSCPAVKTYSISA